MVRLQGNYCKSFVNFTENGACPDVAERMQMEDANNYAFVMDIDGRGYSKRIAYLMFMNTIILKQVSAESAQF